MMMKRRLPFLLFVFGIILILTGFVYDVLFAGIPYQDPTPAMLANYNLHSQIASIIRWSGVGISIIGGLALIIRRVGLSKFTQATGTALKLFSISWVLLLFYFFSDGSPSIWEYFIYDGGLKLLALTSFVYLLLHLRTKGVSLQGMFTLVRRPVVYIVLLGFLSGYLINLNPGVLFEIRFKLSQQALENYARHPALDTDNATVQWVGLFPLREVDVVGTSIRMIVAECHVLDDCGFVYSPNGEPPRVGEDSYQEMPFAGDWCYWQRSW